MCLRENYANCDGSNVFSSNLHFVLNDIFIPKHFDVKIAYLDSAAFTIKKYQSNKSNKSIKKTNNLFVNLISSVWIWVSVKVSRYHL